MTQINPHSGGEIRESATSRIQQAKPTTSARAPERPALAPNVRLIGEMQEAGFKDRQWLVQRDDRFIQLTELLYRVAEQTNGERTLKEIAAGVTKSTDWIVTTDHVRQLIESKLVPMGLIVAADGTIATYSERARSPLALNMRAKVLGPRVIEPIATVLQVFYAPLVLVPVLIAIAVAHGWLYLVHGVAGGVREIVYVPGLMVLVLAVMLVAGVFHEFGHASALRYGGGKVRGMGAGIYLIYPVFYTDTTDSYRLGRWARVRTDLGGFYFHLIFALGIIGLYLVSGQAFLLFVVLLINLDIIRQCLPFVRLDGYWVLADLTGIPDFFSQIGPFLRSVLPVPGWEGSRLPDLKPWVKWTFAAYIALAFPTLLLLLFFFFRNMPGLLVIMWDSFLNQTVAFSQALDSGNVGDMGLSVTQMLILGLQALGIAYLLYSLSRMLAVVAWRWTGSAHRSGRESL
jgi:putative peptide zinc metalloprotease protein